MIFRRLLCLSLPLAMLLSAGVSPAVAQEGDTPNSSTSPSAAPVESLSLNTATASVLGGAVFDLNTFGPFTKISVNNGQSFAINERGEMFLWGALDRELQWIEYPDDLFSPESLPEWSYDPVLSSPFPEQVLFPIDLEMNDDAQIGLTHTGVSLVMGDGNFKHALGTSLLDDGSRELDFIDPVSNDCGALLGSFNFEWALSSNCALSMSEQGPILFELESSLAEGNYAKWQTFSEDGYGLSAFSEHRAQILAESGEVEAASAWGGGGVISLTESGKIWDFSRWGCLGSDDENVKQERVWNGAGTPNFIKVAGTSGVGFGITDAGEVYSWAMQPYGDGCHSGGTFNRLNLGRSDQKYDLIVEESRITGLPLDIPLGPVDVAGTPMEGAVIVDIAASESHTLALAEDGRIFAWGSNDLGQLGNPAVSAEGSKVPVLVGISPGSELQVGDDTVLSEERNGSTVVVSPAGQASGSVPVSIVWESEEVLLGAFARQVDTAVEIISQRDVGESDSTVQLVLSVPPGQMQYLPGKELVLNALGSSVLCSSELLESCSEQLSVVLDDEASAMVWMSGPRDVPGGLTINILGTDDAQSAVAAPITVDMSPRGLALPWWVWVLMVLVVVLALALVLVLVLKTKKRSSSNLNNPEFGQAEGSQFGAGYQAQFQDPAFSQAAVSWEYLYAQASNPGTDPMILHELAQNQPALRAVVAANPACYPELLSWLASLGEPEIDAAIASRFG